MSKLKDLFGPPPKGQEFDDEIFETLKVKVPDYMLYAVILSWIMAGISGLIFLLTFIGIFSDSRSYFFASGSLSLILMTSAITGILSFRWKQRHMLLLSMIANVVWLTLMINTILCYSLLALGWTKVNFKGEYVFHIVIGISAIASIILSVIHGKLVYVLIIEKDPSFFSSKKSEVKVIAGPEDGK
jgi:hypothetical protein